MPPETTLFAQVQQLREQARHQLEAMRETIAEVDDLCDRIESSWGDAESGDRDPEV